MYCEIPHNGFALPDAGHRIFFAEQFLRPGFVNVFTKFKFSGFTVRETSTVVGAADGPSGNDFRETCDILLRIAAVDAQRMQFQDLTRQVLVQSEFLVAAAPVRALAERRIRSDRSR